MLGLPWEFCHMKYGGYFCRNLMSIAVLVKLPQQHKHINSSRIIQNWTHFVMFALLFPNTSSTFVFPWHNSSPVYHWWTFCGTTAYWYVFYVNSRSVLNLNSLLVFHAIKQVSIFMGEMKPQNWKLEILQPWTVYGANVEWGMHWSVS